ncbi:PilN domain-containing protein [Pseudomonas indica]|uniref:PilN domain-containing protein n=1 Tax=Pseudomonas indica TaxID=137658 RepID=UPI000BAB894A|nr:PilN domain-containing protein [Pseudomonas indica]PAU55007.1 hypothetical protein BZL42_19440 [Pseudomonas indica]
MTNHVQWGALGPTVSSLTTLAQRFWLWWSQELLGLIPPAWRERLRRRGNLLLIALHDSHCDIRCGTYTQTETAISSPFGADGEWPPTLAATLLERAPKADRVILLLPPGKVLRKVIGLPSATESGLENVLRFEMDRHTPFSSEQVYFGYRILERDRARQRLQVELLVVLREYLDGLLKHLDSLGVRPSLVTLGHDDGRWSGDAVNLLPGSRRRGRSGRWRGNPRLQAIAGLVIVALLVAFPLLLQRQRTASLNDALSGPQAVAERAAKVRDDIQRLESGRDYLQAQRMRATEPLLLLKELTGLLPDGTWLSRFELIGERVRMEGESTEASALIGLLEQSRMLQNVSFASPVTSNPRTQRDRFSLVAERRAPAEGTP